MEGNQVGELARQRYSDGVLVEADFKNSGEALEQTRKFIESGELTLFEPAFIYEGVLVRVDILTRLSLSEPWEIVEVKSSTQVKDDHLTDVAIQTWVLRSSGEKVQRCSVMVINNQCVFPDLVNFFNLENVTDEVEERVSQIPKIVKNLKSVLSEFKSPKADIGPHCGKPYECQFKDHCWEAAGIASPSIFELPGVGKKAWEFYERGIKSLTDLNLEGLTGKAARAIDVVRSNVMWIDRNAIMNGIKDWEWPLYFLDFETFGPAVPRYEGVRPYQQVPFQFSCHIQESPGTELRHVEYLHDDATDPRWGVAKALSQTIGLTGNIVAYNKSVESRVVSYLAEECPEFAEKLKLMSGRFVDPLPIIRNAVYAPEFRGSFSIKNVAPALLGEKYSYNGLDVGGGQEAQNAFDRLISPDTSVDEKEKLKASMLAYCGQDTLAMAELVKWLQRQVSE